MFHVPELPADYFSPNTTADHWWTDPDRHGHGPFDLLTPPLAASLLAANASAALCPALSGLLMAASISDPANLCESLGVCTSLLPELQAIFAVLEEAGGPALDPCDGCNLLLEGVCWWDTCLG